MGNTLFIRKQNITRGVIFIIVLLLSIALNIFFYRMAGIKPVYFFSSLTFFSIALVIKELGQSIQLKIVDNVLLVKEGVGIFNSHSKFPLERIQYISYIKYNNSPNRRYSSGGEYQAPMENSLESNKCYSLIMGKSRYSYTELGKYMNLSQINLIKKFINDHQQLDSKT